MTLTFTGGRCPHSTRSDASPRRCSLCLRAAARPVTVVGAELFIDGKPAGRPINAENESAQRFYAKRGGKR